MNQQQQQQRQQHQHRQSSTRSVPMKSSAMLAIAAGLLLASFSSSSCSAFVVPTVVRGGQRCLAGEACNNGQRPRARRAGKSMVVMKSLGGDGGGMRDGLAKQEFNTMLDAGSTQGCLKLLQKSGTNLELDMTQGSKLLTLVSNDLLKKPRPNEDDVTTIYTALKSAGLLKAFGSLDLDVVPAKTRDMSPEKLMDLTGMNVQNLAPGRPTGSWAAAGAGLFGMEFLLGELLGLDPLQTIIPLTLSLFLLDRVAVGGAVAESVIRALVPGYRERIIRHEAGHFLVAYLLGCPVQGCLLDPLTVGRFASSGAQGGTVFADPTFAKGMSSGKLTRSAIDRFTIVLMGGIAAESIQYGNSEGGSADEGVMIGILSTIAPPFDMDQIKSQALWSATQAVLIINEHKEAYEALVVALSSGAELGECVRAMEKELAKKPLPGDVRREDLKPRSPADEVRGMVVRRMSQRYWANQEERAAAAVASAGTGASSGSVASRVADNDKAMLDLQRRVEDLERTIAGGKSIDDQGLKEDDGGVWMNDLKALREDIKATNDKNKVEAALDAVLADDPTTAVASSPGAVLLASPSSSAATMPAVSTPSTPAAAASSPSTPEPSQQDKQKMTDIDIKTAENAKRMADVEARLRKFDEKHPR